MSRRIRVAALACSVLLVSGCYRVTHEIVDTDNPDTVFMSPSEQGGVATHFERDVTLYTSLFGLIAWNSPRPGEILAPYFNSGKVQNLVIFQDQSFVEGLVTMLFGAGLVVGMRHVRYEGDVIRRIGG